MSSTDPLALPPALASMWRALVRGYRAEPWLLDGARVVETGTHEELIARGGQYAELYQIQASAYR